MRVLVTVNDAYGHILPLVPTVRELARQGHEVLLASPGPTAALAGGPGVLVRRYVPRPTPPVPPPPPRSQHADRLAWAVGRSWPNVARGWVDALLADAAEWRPDLVLVEPVEHAGRVVAAALDVPLVEHGWGFTLPAGADDAGADSLAAEYRRIGRPARPPDLRVDLGHPSIQAADLPPGVRRHRYVAWAPSAPALPRPGAAPRVLLTLGTFDHSGAADRLRVVASAAATLPAEVVVVLGNPDRRPGPPWRPGVLVRDWVNLPSEVAGCALVVHHGGAGTSWACLSAGVPAVCLPQAGDQFRNAGLLAAAGAAVPVSPDRVGEDDLAAVLAHALASPAVERAAARARGDNAALPGPDDLVERLAREA